MEPQERAVQPYLGRRGRRRGLHSRAENSARSGQWTSGPGGVGRGGADGAILVEDGQGRENLVPEPVLQGWDEPDGQKLVERVVKEDRRFNDDMGLSGEIGRARVPSFAFSPSFFASMALSLLVIVPTS